MRAKYSLRENATLYIPNGSLVSGTDNVNNAAEPGSGPQLAAVSGTAGDVDVRKPMVRRSPSVAQAILLGGAAAQLGLSLLITIYLARILSPAAFGFFALVGAVLILARKFLDLGLGNVAARDIARDPARERPILEGMMAYRRAGGVLAMAVVAVFAVTQQGGAERAVLLGVAAVLLFTEPAALDPVFQVRQAQGGPALINIGGGLLVFVGALLCQRAGTAGANFAWLLVLREIAILLGTKILAERLLGYQLRPGFRGRALESFVRPALVFGLASLVYTIYFHCDVFFVEALRGQNELGAYAAAFRPINPLLVLPWLLMSPLVPVMSATAMRDMELFVRQVRGICAAALGIGACAAVAGAMLAPELVQLLYKGRYLQGTLSTVSAFRWLAVAFGMVAVTTVLTASLLASGREKLLLAIGVTALAVNAGLNLVLLRHYDFTAAAFATAATELLFLLGALIAFYIVTRCSPLTLSSALYLAPALIVAGLLHVTGGGPTLRVGCGIFSGLLSVIAILMAPPTRRLRRELASASPAI